MIDRTPARRGRSLLARGAALLLALGATLVLTAPAASAHAVVVSSSPAAGEHVTPAPSSVSIQFSEPVSVRLGGLTVIDAKGNRVDNGDDRQPRSDTLESSLKPDLADGTYVANYQIISADGHPIRGSIVFGVGEGALGDVSGLQARTNTRFDAANKVGQFLTYLGVMLAAGLSFFLAFVVDTVDGSGPDGGRGSERRRLGRITWSAAAVGVAGVVLTLVTQAALETDGSVGAVLRPSVARTMAGQGLGWQTAVQLIGLGCCLLSLRPPRTVARQVLALYGGLAATGAMVLFGHAAQSRHPWLTVPADVVHVAVGAVWLGGLVGLFVVVRSRRRLAAGALAGAGPDAPTAAATDDATPVVSTGAPGESASSTTALLERQVVEAGSGGADDGDRLLAATAGVVDRFSTVAAVSVLLLVIAGLTLGVVEVGSVGRLFSTTYGRLLLAKVTVVGLVLLMAGYNRYRLVPELVDRSGSRSSESSAWPALTRSLQFEAVGLVVVLALTAVLANTTPAIDRAAEPRPFSQSQPFLGGQVRLDISPNAPGANQITVEVTDAQGNPVDSVLGVTAYYNLPAKGVGPLDKNLTKIGPGQYQLDDPDDLSIAGDWKVTLQIRTGEFEESDVDFVDTVR